MAIESKVNQVERRLSFQDYGERWRSSREVGWAVETRRRVESNLRCHLYPIFGNQPIRSITVTRVLEWVSYRLDQGTPKSTLKLYFELLAAVVAAAVVDKVIEETPEVELVDITSGDPVRRTVPQLFTTTHGNPFTDRTWSREWVGWRDAAGWPKEQGGFHALRHFFATTLITNHAEPQEVQRLVRHKTLRITLETYVHWWPKRDRARGVVGGVLSRAREQSRKAQNQT